MSPIRVLVVDDSAFARKVLREVLQAAPDIDVVGTARDGLDALSKIEELDPDVVTLDLVMPNLDGLDTLRALAGRARPRVIVVCMAESDSELALSALDAGAIDIVHKPTALATERLYDLAQELLFKVRAAAEARSTPVAVAPPRAVPAPLANVYKNTVDLVVIGASTGGPNAVTRVLESLPADFPAPVAVVVHLPAGFTQSFAERLDAECALKVVEASEGLRLDRGTVAIARGGWHLQVKRDGRGLFVGIGLQPLSLHRPSVDQLFTSAASAARGRVLGVVLTGMGDDGLEGSRKLVQAGGAVLSEDEATCVVYGMPRVVREAGLASREYRIEAMAKAIIDRV